MQSMLTVATFAVALASSAPVEATSIDHQLTKVDQERQRCQARDKDPSPAQLQACDSSAIDAYDALLRRSKSNPTFERLVPSLFESLLYRATGGEDALAMRVVVLSGLTDLARSRVVILAGARDKHRVLRARKDLFGWVSDSRAREELRTNWSKIRKNDCKIYPVPQCRQRLDAALSKLISDVRP